MPVAYAYPFDPVGKLLSNKIVAEQHIVTSVNYRDYHIVIPNFAPFFEESLTIEMKYPDNTVRPLVLGVDYYFSHQFLDASKACAKPIFGSISFTDTDMFGVLTIGYQTIGGMWNITLSKISEILANLLRNPRITSWDQIVELPATFPVIDHEWDLVDMIGEKELIASIDSIRDAMLDKNSAGISTHITDFSNPHGTTKFQVGLGLVANYPPATSLGATAGTSEVSYMSPLRTKEAIDKFAGELITTHTSNNANPHNTTKAQVGLGNVDNFKTATEASAIAGVDNTEFMTPYLVRKAMTGASGGMLSHVVDTSNPHGVTKAQVGLFNVENYIVATIDEAKAATRNDRYMTPLRTGQLVTEYVRVKLDGHATDFDNPHATTKVQVGLGNVDNYQTASAAIALGRVSTTHFMTPFATTKLIESVAGDGIDTHKADLDNPHQVTKLHVGLEFVDNFATATNVEALGRASVIHFMTPATTALVATQISQEAVNPHVLNMANPHGMTPFQLGVYDKAEIDTFLLAKQNEADPAFNSSKFEGMTKDTYIDYLRANWTDIDASVFDGRTYPDLVTSVKSSLAAFDYAPQKKHSTVVAPTGAVYTNTWISICTLTKRLAITPDMVSYVNGCDSLVLFTGGGDFITYPNKKDSSAILHLSVKDSNPSNPCSLAVESFNNSDLSDFEFGYTWDNTLNIMIVWVKLSKNARVMAAIDLVSSATTLTFPGLGNPSAHVIVEPADIIYVTATNTIKDLTDRLTLLEAKVALHH